MPHPVRHRRSIRLPDYDYSTPGAYFVTICTHERECLFGEVVDGGVVVNSAGVVVEQTWHGLIDHYPCVQLDQFVVMPNHVHGIILLTHDNGGVGGHDDERDVRAGLSIDVGAGFKPAPTPARRHGLAKIVRGFKTFSARHVNLLRLTPGHPLWQRSYYEHVIRNDRDLAAIREYIAGNPARWLLDKNHPGNGPVDC